MPGFDPPTSGGPLELPEMVPAVLDAVAVERLFSELAFETSVLGILVKGGQSERARAEAPTLRTARDVLLAGEAEGVQIRFVHRGVELWDTVLRTPGGFRLVRVRK
jgi:hypothetical protein